MNRADIILADIDGVPPLSQATLRLVSILADDGRALADVIRIIEADAALTANVLRYANCAAFCRGGEVSSLDRAVSVLGGRMVLAVALAAGASGVYGSALAGYEASRGELWRHSLRTAIACRELSRFAKTPVSADVAYTAGILHDIGKSIISEHLKGSTSHILELIDEAKVPNFLEAERTLLDTDHTELGAKLAERWQLSPSLALPVRYHHNPRACPEEYRTLAYVVHLGDIVAMMGGSATGADAMMYPLDGRYQEYIELSEGDIERVMLLVALEFEKTRDLMFGGSEHGS